MATTSAPAPATARAEAQPWTALVGSVVLHILLIIGAFLMVFPFLWMVLTSLKEYSQVFVIPPQWLPNPIRWDNYIRSLQALPFGRAYFNSFYISFIVVAEIGRASCRER